MPTNRTEAAHEIAVGVQSLMRLRILLERMQIEIEKVDDRGRAEEPGRVAARRLSLLRRERP